MTNIEATANQIFKENKELSIHLIGDFNSDYMGYVGSLIDTKMKIEDYERKKDNPMVLYHNALKKELVNRFLKFCETNKVKYCR